VSAKRVASASASLALALVPAPAGLAGAAEANRQSAPGAMVHSAAKRASSGPPLSSFPTPGEATDSSGVPSSEGDPLVENGLSSPLCNGAMSGSLSPAAHTNCQTSHFVGAPAPTGSYGLDVHIDVGPLGLSKGGLLSVIQDMFVTPLWNALVWVVHALVVMLEWCYTLELLGGSTMGDLARSLQQAQASFTGQWLALVLAVASVLALYNGLIRRRVTETLGQVLATIAMMGFGLWVIADPLGTVGAVGRWANQASLGTFGVVAQGTPANAPRTLADSTHAVFAAAIEMPWCYLEFGNVRWCSDPRLLDPRLHRAGLLIEARQKAMIGCKPSVTQLCATPGSPAALAVERSAQLMDRATTNGALFLAFPANGPERNAITENGSLLQVLCQAADDTRCTGPTASQAEFRSASGTFPRMIGVVLIALGVLGMVMLLGLVALHLLAAAVVSLFMLLLAPFVVLAPALGDGGRAVFIGWATRLLAAVTSKLLFSFLLGALLTMQRMLTSLQPLGWWTEWLLISAFWWTVFLKRHQALALLQGRGRETVARNRRDTQGVRHRLHISPVRGLLPASWSAGRARERSSPISHPVRWAWDKLHSPAPATEQLTKREHARHGGQGTRLDTRMHKRKRARAWTPTAMSSRASPDDQVGTLAKRAQLMRVRRAREAAIAGGERQRAAKLAVRERRVEGELAGERRSRDSQRMHDRDSQRSPRFDRERELNPVPEQGDHAGSSPMRVGTGFRRSMLPLPDSKGSGERDAAEKDGPRTRSRERKSRVMDDARAVAEGRKRQLGYGPPP
jgi:hypothetical protein